MMEPEGWPLMRSALLLAVLALAGCSGGPEESPPPFVEPVEEGPQWVRFEATYELVRTEVQTPAISHGRGSGNGNCLMFDDDAVIDGTATVSWDPESTDPEMELVLSSPKDLVFQTGSGEIVLEFSQFKVERGQFSGSPLAWQVSQSEPAGVVYEQTATLVLALDVLLEDSEDEFTPDENWSCSIGH